jgi:hypothetical protein
MCFTAWEVCYSGLILNQYGVASP